ncbi:MAG: type II toxin-antitoxin system VapC family toxin [Terracidiphilus sp.]|jgi:predicted nucleic acid-binding protein
MILADTTIWIDHFRSSDPELQLRLGNDEIVMHPFVAGELALGPLPNRRKVLAYLDHLPQLRPAQQSEVRQMVETRSLHNQGIGLIDAHLIASTLIETGAQLWTRDGGLRRVASSLGILASLP